MLKVTDILERLTVAELEELAGPSSVKLLKELKPNAISKPGLAQLLLHQFGERAILHDSAIRNLVILKLHREEAAAICGILGVPSVDPIDTLLGAVTNPAKLEKFIGHFALPSMTGFPLRLPPSSQAATPQPMLYDHQTEGYRLLRASLNRPNAKILVNMPSGAGKIRMIAVAVADLFRAAPEGSTIVWFALGEQLCEDAFNELFDSWEKLGTRSVTVTRAFGQHKVPDISNITDGIFVVDVRQFAAEPHNAAQLKALANRASAVILHEALFLENGSFEVPYRLMDDEPDLRVVAVCPSYPTSLQALGRQAWLSNFDDIITLPTPDPIKFLTEAGVIAPVEVEILDVTPSVPVPGVASEFDISDADHEALAQDMERNAKLIGRIVNEVQNDGVVVFFASTALQAKMFTGILAFHGHAASTVTSVMSVEARRQEILRFQSQSDVAVLCVHDVLIEGRDVPKATAAVMSAPTLSPTKLSEVWGRLLSGKDGASGSFRLIVVDDGLPGYKDLVHGTTIWSAAE